MGNRWWRLAASVLVGGLWAGLPGVAQARMDGPAPSRPTADPAGRPVLGGTILAARWTDTGPEGLLTLRPDGSGRRPLVSGRIDGASFSPDGREIAFAQDGDIFVMSANGGTPRRVVSGPHDSSRPTWSPDGRYLAYASARVTDDGEEQLPDIFRVTVASPAGSVVRLTSDALDAASRCDPASRLPAGFAKPAWDPRGRYLAATAYCLPAPDEADQSLVYLAPQGGRILRVLYAPPGPRRVEPDGPAWSSDGTKVALTDVHLLGQLGPPTVWVMNADGSGLRKIVDVPDEEDKGAGSPHWAPDGRHLAYVRWESWDTQRLWIANTATARKSPVPGGAGLIPLDWTSRGS